MFIARDPQPVAAKFLFVLRDIGAAEDLGFPVAVQVNGRDMQGALHSDAQTAGAEGFIFGHGR